MCGIVYAKSFKNRDVTNSVIDIFNQQRDRGTTSFGFYLPEKDRLTHHVKERRIKRLMKRTKGLNNEILFHHRLSTSTIDVRNACHPFSTKDYFENQYIGVHNGVIYNSTTLRDEHSKLGISYVSTQADGTFNDSEALIYDLARYFDGLTDKVTARGSVAFVIVKRVKGEAVSVLFGRNAGSPLKVYKNRKGVVISSEGPGLSIPANTLHELDYKTHKITTTPMGLPESSFYSGYYSNGYYNKEGVWHYYENYSPIHLDDDDEYGFSFKGTSQVGKIKIRSDSFRVIYNEILEENNYDYLNAALQADAEMNQANKKIDEIDFWAQFDEDDVSRAKYIDEYDKLEQYANLLGAVAERLYSFAYSAGQPELLEAKNE